MAANVLSASAGVDWKQRLDLAVRCAKGEVIGASLVKELHHGRLIVTALQAFGEDPRSVFYIEGRSERAETPRPDLIPMHPEVGVLVIENKGVDLGSIHDSPKSGTQRRGGVPWVFSVRPLCLGVLVSLC